MFEIIPGILEKEWAAVERKIKLVRPFANTIHIDLLDGKFAPNISFQDPAPFAKYRDEFVFELHMMVVEPIDYIETWAQAGFKRFIGHIEHMSDQDAFIQKAKQFGEAALAIDGPTPIEDLQASGEEVDAFLVMTITAGFSGQAFVNVHTKKIKALREKTKAPIEVDGGVTDQTLRLARNAGANRFVTTSFLFKNDPLGQYQLLKNCLAL